MKTIVSVSGTSRPDNYTSHALAVVNERLREVGVGVKEIDARDLDLSFPGHDSTEDARRLQAAIREAEAVVLATPEYHGTFAAMTKLIIENMGFPSVLRDKPVALLGVAAGRIGAVKSLEQLRGVCAHVGAIVLPNSISIAGVQKAFDEDGRCVDERSRAALQGLADSLVDFIKDYVCPKAVLESMVREGDVDPWAAEV